MLDSIDGWLGLETVGIAYAFKKDRDNRGWIVDFVDLSDRKWGVRL